MKPKFPLRKVLLLFSLLLLARCTSTVTAKLRTDASHATRPRIFGEPHQLVLHHSNN